MNGQNQKKAQRIGSPTNLNDDLAVVLVEPESLPSAPLRVELAHHSSLQDLIARALRRSAFQSGLYGQP